MTRVLLLLLILLSSCRATYRARDLMDDKWLCYDYYVGYFDCHSGKLQYPDYKFLPTGKRWVNNAFEVIEKRPCPIKEHYE